MRWALEAQDPEGWLTRVDPELISANDGMFKHHLDRYKYPDRYGSKPDKHRADGLHFLQELDSRIARAGQLCGTKQGFTDTAIMPFVRQFAAVDRDWFDAQRLPSLQGWLASHLASDRFASVMYRAAPWSEGDQPIIVDGFKHIHQSHELV
ncbi:hypothetical protein SPMU_23760 [Sphingomonas mucosissima]|uniref:Uncharacterized protein n=2 Tax=Sphingomonas mucosissima TaxID=370959 RepID=A0A245ZJP3_9SPHN|nr:hypothetical protein SPMU_23760 [Sphingomonas mucosissima]